MFSNTSRLIFDPFLQVVEANRNDEAREAIIGMDKQWNFICRASSNRRK
jgi:uncharacterized DUF497 family protein